MLNSTEKMSARHGKAQQWYSLSPCLLALLYYSGGRTMGSESFSVIVRYCHDLLTNTTQLRVLRVDTNKEVHLSDGSFLLRISRDENTSVERCLIRHIATGREAYVQGGPNLRAFVKACLLSNGESNTT
jgi:hypothetical protein